MIIYQDVEPIVVDRHRAVYRDHVVPLVPSVSFCHRHARCLRLGKRRVLRLYAEASNGTFPVTVVGRA